MNISIKGFVLLIFLFLIVHVGGYANLRSEMETDKNLVLHHLANEGMVISCGNLSVVVDFPFVVEADWCVGPKPEQIAALMAAKPPFEHIDAFLFTHDHLDHFDPALVKQALKAHPKAAMIGTHKVLERLRALGEVPRNPMFEAVAGNSIAWKGIVAMVLKAPHARYWDLDPATGEKKIYDDGYIHVAYDVTLGGHSFVHGGDAYEIEYPANMTTDLLLLDRGNLWAKGHDGLKVLHQKLKAQRTLLMHIGPTEVRKVTDLIARESFWISALSEPGQVVSVH